MKQLMVLCADNCGYCKKAKMLIKRALETHPKYLSLDIRFLEVDSNQSETYPHELIPAFYCGRVLFFEGNPSMDIVLTALNDCYE